MKILITNCDLSDHAGTQLYVRDLALSLLERGHTPFVYSPILGEVAQELRQESIPVVDSLKDLSVVPDVIHGHHHLETMTALLRFPGVPAVYFCHGSTPWQEIPPIYPRVLQYVVVEHTCRDLLLNKYGISEEKIKVLLNFVNLKRFKPRGPLPSKPKRALVFSNYAKENNSLTCIRQTCRRAGIQLDVVGSGVSNACSQPELILGNYDLVFAKARAAIEAMAVGNSVILCHMGLLGPMVTTKNLEKLRPLNFGMRVSHTPINTHDLTKQIELYDAEDASKVSERIRQVAGQETVIDQIISLYQEILQKKVESNGHGSPEEFQAVSHYLRLLQPRLQGYDELQAQVEAIKKTRLMLLHKFLHRIPVVRTWVQRTLS